MYDYAHVRVEFLFSTYPETFHFKEGHLSAKSLTWFGSPNGEKITQLGFSNTHCKAYPLLTIQKTCILKR